MNMTRRVKALEGEHGDWLSYEECLRRLIEPNAFPGRSPSPEWIDGLRRLAGAA